MFDDIMLFVKVVNSGNFLLLSHRLGIAQSTISRKIKVLEDSLGVQLLKRNTRNLELTEKGKNLYENFKDCEHDLLKLIDPILFNSKIVHGTLTVLMPPAFSTYAITSYLGQFIRDYPELKLVLYYQFREINMVKDSYDIAIISYLPKQNSQRVKMIYTSKLILVCTQEYIDKYGFLTEIDALKNHLIVGKLLTEDSAPITSIDVYSDSSKIPITVEYDFRIRVNSFNEAIKIIKSGEAIAAIPEESVSAELKSGHLIRLMPQYNFGQVSYYALRNIDHDDLRYKVFMQFINSCIKRVSTQET